MRPILALLPLALLSLPPAQATDAGSAALAEIGRINGVALACSQPAISSRARNAVTTTAPKTRENGEIFENASNAAFLEQGKGGKCPAGSALAQQLAEAEKQLVTAFPAVK